MGGKGRTRECTTGEKESTDCRGEGAALKVALSEERRKKKGGEVSVRRRQDLEGLFPPQREQRKRKANASTSLARKKRG